MADENKGEDQGAEIDADLLRALTGATGRPRVEVRNIAVAMSDADRKEIVEIYKEENGENKGERINAVLNRVADANGEVSPAADADADGDEDAKAARKVANRSTTTRNVKKSGGK